MPREKTGFTTWSDLQSFQRASVSYAKAQNEIAPINRSTASMANRFRNIDTPNTSVRDSYSRLDYEFFRPNEAMPKYHKDIIGACMEAYKRIGVIRQVIDVMGEFCSQGARLVHPNKSVEKFYRTWWERINGSERSERFANLLYRTGNIVVKRSMAKLDQDTADEWRRTIADIDLSPPEEIEVRQNEIPIRYTFLNPLALDVVGGELAAFTGQYKYVLRMPNKVSSLLNVGLFGLDPSILMDDIPNDIKNAITNNHKHLVLQNNKILTFFYKKDDWEVWAYPMLYSLLDDLIYLEKMKLADLTALDGIISHIRIWKLGSLEHKIFPTDAAIAKLSSILLNHVAGGAMDFIWGPDLTIEETSTDLHQFLGSEKYQAVISSIHGGLGIPTSQGGGAGGTFSQSFMSIRTILERLQYGRRMLDAFWMPEIRIVQKAMGFRYPARIVYDNQNMQDDVSEKALWIQLVDRNIVSEESIQEKFGQIPEIEEIRLKRESADRLGKKRTPKVSPYHDAQPNLSKEKIALQRGVVTPSQVGMELDEKDPGEKSIMEMQTDQMKIKIQEQKKKPIGRSGQGRPKTSKDSQKRKKRTVLPSSKADSDEFVNLTLYANQLQRIIHEEVTPFFLEKFGKSNMRQLTQAEEKELDDFKHILLYNVNARSVPSPELVRESLSKPIEMNANAIALYKQLIRDFNIKKGKEPTYEDIKQLRNLVYSSIKGNYFEDEKGDE